MIPRIITTQRHTVSRWHKWRRLAVRSLKLSRIKIRHRYRHVRTEYDGYRAKVGRMGALILLGKSIISGWYFNSSKGRLSWYILTKLAFRNLKHSWTRTIVTGGAIAMGTAAMVFLVSFGYGIQDIVTNRLVQPNSLRLTDVQSDSTALALNRASITAIASLSEVVDVAPVVSLAGSVSLDTSRTEVVIIAAENRYIDYSGAQIITGQKFSPEADKPYQANVNEIKDLVSLANQGMVAGLSTSQEDEPKPNTMTGEDGIAFRLTDEQYFPLRSSPRINASITGYVRGSSVHVHEGVPYWGGTYETSGSTGRAYRSSDGQWLGKWIKTKVPVWDKAEATVFVPQYDANGNQVTAEGYLAESGLLRLSKLETEMNALSVAKIGEGLVLGDSTASAALSEQEALNLMVLAEAHATASAAKLNTTIEVKRIGGKEIMVTTGLLSLWKLEAKDVIDKTMHVEMIVSGGLIPGIGGRLMSQPVDYKIVGVIKNASKPMIYVPLGDITSMGIDRYTAAKVLATKESTLQAVRAKIEGLGFMTQSIVDTLLQVTRLFRVMRFLLGVIGLIALVIALLGMFNTLTISLLERTREVGVMKTMGTMNFDVVRIYLTESMLLGIGGGIVGIFLGVGLGEAIDAGAKIIRGSEAAALFNAPPSFLFSMLALSVCVGVLTGMYPAHRATKVSGLDALRYE